MGSLTARQVGYGLGGVGVALSAGLLLIDSLPSRIVGWAVAGIGVAITGSILLTEIASRRRGLVFGLTSEILTPAGLAGASAALLVVHAWGWALWVA